MKLQNFFARYPLLTRDDLAAHLAAQGERSPRTIDSLLAYHVRSGRLRRIRRGLYAVVDRAGDAPVDSYLVASRLAPDAILAYHTALELHGRAYSVHHQVLFLSRHRFRPLDFEGVRYRAVRPPKVLRDLGQELTGVEMVDRAGLDVPVTRLERTLVDVLDRPELGGGWEEIWSSLETVEFFDLDLVLEYALLLDNATTAAKVGYFLEEHRDALQVDAAVLETLRGQRPSQPHYIERGMRGRGRLITAWNLVVPEDLLRRSWEELA